LLSLAMACASCGYGPRTAQHRLAGAMPEPEGHRFAVAVMTVEMQEPAGLITRLEARGKSRILSEQMRLYLCDADDGSVAPLGRLARPGEVRSGFAAWIVGWDPPGEKRAVYLEVNGNKGETPQSERLRWLLRVEVSPNPGATEAISFLPNEARRPRPEGPLRGGPEAQVRLAAEVIDVRTDARPEYAALFHLDAISGIVTPAAAAIFPGRPPAAKPETAAAPPAGAAARAPGTAPPAAVARPAPAIWCDSVDFFLRRVSTATPKRGFEPYEDPVAVRKFPAGSMVIEGAWTTINPDHAPWDALGDWLAGLGFQRDPQYDADGPDGTSALFRRGDRYLAYSAGWWSPGPANERPGAPEAPSDTPPTSYRLQVWSGVLGRTGTAR
jgi:hypothetical protein